MKNYQSALKVNCYAQLTTFLSFVVIVGLYLSFSTWLNVAFANNLDKKDSVVQSWEKKGGIRILSIRRTAADYMLDFRYKVIDPKKAAIFIDRSNKPLLKILKNGKFLKVPVTAKIGPLRQSANFAKAGKNYFMFFGNPGRMVKAGDKVQLHIGDFKSNTLTIE